MSRMFKRSSVRLVSGSVLPAHRAVLVARCDVMAAMFSGKYAEARSRVVPIHGVSSDTFLAFLEYLYTDTCCPGKDVVLKTFKGILILYLFSCPFKPFLSSVKHERRSFEEYFNC